MITAAVTAIVGGVLALFGVKPGPYLVVVAVVVKIAIVAATLVVGARWVRRRPPKSVSAGAETASRASAPATGAGPGAPSRPGPSSTDA